jgi:hypothetical protein
MGSGSGATNSSGVASGVGSRVKAKINSGIDLRVDSSRHLKKKSKIKSVSSVTMQHF